MANSAMSYQRLLKQHLAILFAFLVAPTQALANTDLYTMLSTLQLSLGAIWQMLMASCWLFGIMVLLSGMLKLKKYGQMTVFMMSHAELVGPLSRILVGTLLIYTPYAIDTVLGTLWQDATVSDIQGYPASTSTGSASLMGPVFTIIQVIGLIAFIRGMLKLTKAGEQGTQPGTIPSAFMLVFGGVMCMNIVETLNTVRSTIGLEPLGLS